MHGRFCVLVFAACTVGTEPPPATLVSTSSEAPGAHCAAGGTAVHNGSDTNGNGTLDPDEITTTSYVCTPLGSVPKMLVDYVDESPGANCADGGEAIHWGLDTNDNGHLDASEISNTVFICNAMDPTTIVGTYWVYTALDAARLIGVRRITGDLMIDATNLTSIDLSSLVEIDGELMVEGYQGSTLALPALSKLGGDLGVLPYLDSISFDVLPTLYMTYVRTHAFHAPQVAISGGLQFWGLTSDLSLPELTSGGVTVINAGPGVSVDLPLMVHGPVDIDAHSLSAPLLTDGYRLSLTHASSVTVPSLVSVEDFGLGNTPLTSLDFPSLTSATNVYIVDNAQLSTCAAQTFAAALHPTSTTISGNGPC